MERPDRDAPRRTTCAPGEVAAVVVRPLPQGLPDDLGQPELPGSKSHAQRALLLAALAPGRRSIAGLPGNDDVRVLIEALQQAGAQFAPDGDAVAVDGIAAGAALDVAIDVAANGTALRMLLSTIPLLGGRLAIDGDARLRQRPLGATLAALASAGVELSGEGLPLVADGRSARRLPAVVDGAVTTQAASGLLLALALRGQGGQLRVRRARAQGYLQLTATVLRHFGVAVQGTATGDDLLFEVGPGLPQAVAYEVPPDPSARAFPMALAAMHGRDAAPMLPRPLGDPHPDWAIDCDLAALRGVGDLCLDDLDRRPDCVPALAVVAATRAGTTRMPHLANLRGKESDRLAALAAGLKAAGARAELRGAMLDELLVAGPLAAGGDVPRILPAPEDHRIVMALGLLGTVVPGGVRVKPAHAVAKSWPGFFAWLARCAEVTIA